MVGGQSRSALWLAGGLSLARFVTFTALPIFYLREAGVPGYALDLDRDLFADGDGG
jgi:hypothetical protein